VSLVVSSAIYSVFILGPFQSLVVVDVTIYAFALILEFAALVALRIREPEMPRPYKIPGGWPVIAIVCLLPFGIIVFALYNQVAAEGWAHAVGLAALFLISGPVLYPIAKYYKKRRGETDELPDMIEHEMEEPV
jgi:amino acid transporter